MSASRMEFQRTPADTRNVFVEVGKGLVLAVVLNCAAGAAVLALTTGSRALLVAGSAEWIRVVARDATMFGSVWLMGFSIVQLSYQVPACLLLVLSGRRAMMLGVVMVVVVTILLQTICVGVGAVWMSQALNQAGAHH